MRSAPITLDSRCARIKVVRPCARRSIACWITASFSASTEDSASSRIRIGESRSSARAIASRWRWPPDRLTPRSPMTVRYPRGNCRMNSWALASRAACFQLGLRGVRLAEPQILFDRAVEQVGVLVHDRDLRPQRLGVEPPDVLAADPTPPRPCGSNRRNNSRAIEDLPEPLGPTMPIFSPAATAKDSPSCAGCRPPG